jgi:hypothetical protein
MSDSAFLAWLIVENLDQQIWIPELLAALKRRFEKSQEKLVIDGTGCEWPTRTYRVNQNENTPGE